jgi:hypothetical protein
MPSAKAQVAETLLEQAIVWSPRVPRSTVPVAALLGRQARASAGVVRGRVATILERPFPGVQAAAQARSVVPAASARSAERAAQRGAVPRAEASAQHEAVPVAAVAVAQRGAEPRPEAVAELGAAAERLRGVAAVAEPVAAAVPQPEAVVAAERDGAVRRRAVEPGGVGPRQVALSVPPSVSVCRRGQLRQQALAPAPRPAAPSARRKWNSQPTSP